MSKWKCEICGSEFENFHAQGFDNKIYCSLCFFKKENQQLKEQLQSFAENCRQKDEVIGEAIEYLNNGYLINTKNLKNILNKYKKVENNEN